MCVYTFALLPTLGGSAHSEQYVAVLIIRNVVNEVNAVNMRMREIAGGR